MSSKNRKKRPRVRSESSEDSSSSSSTSSNDSDEETDSKDLKSIKEYISNRTELASQLFKSVKPEKIRLMLPQILKKIDLDDLQEWCASELTGMSKKRILCILNGQEMAQSSDTNDSDDSGPSLEIISDTEWLSDDEIGIRRDVKQTKNKDSKKKNALPNANNKNKTRVKTEKNEKSNVKVKQEKKKEVKKEPKEGESLLDLLELEMRARAIRALIRKEEDSTTGKSNNNAQTSTNSTSSARQANLKEQLERIDVLMKHGDDEDVLVVVSQAPMIELLSSDEDELGGKTNKEVLSEQKNNASKVTSEARGSSVLDKVAQTLNKTAAETLSKSDDVQSKVSNIEDQEEGEIDERESKPEETLGPDDKKPSNNSLVKSKIKKDKKRKKKDSEKSEGSGKTVMIGKEKKENLIIQITNDRIKPLKTSEVPPVKSKAVIQQEEPIVIPDSPKDEKPNLPIDIFDDKSLDPDTIINLDDYPDEIDVLKDLREEDDSEDLVVKPAEEGNKNNSKDESLKNETWASRYMQQEEVQNVLKESKIQSEIRKRLRERQRLRKANSQQSVVSELPKSPVIVPKPTGSVEEYEALKAMKTMHSADKNSISSVKSEIPAASSCSSAIEENTLVEISLIKNQSLDEVKHSPSNMSNENEPKTPETISGRSKNGDNEEKNIDIENKKLQLSKDLPIEDQVSNSDKLVKDIHQISRIDSHVVGKTSEQNNTQCERKDCKILEETGLKCIGVKTDISENESLQLNDKSNNFVSQERSENIVCISVSNPLSITEQLIANSENVKAQTKTNKNFEQVEKDDSHLSNSPKERPLIKSVRTLNEDEMCIIRKRKKLKKLSPEAEDEVKLDPDVIKEVVKEEHLVKTSMSDSDDMNL